MMLTRWVGMVLCVAGMMGLTGSKADSPSVLKPLFQSKGPKLVLVKDGVAQVPIIVFKDAPPYTRKAADELAGYIEKISGAKPQVIEGLPDPLPEHAVWVGYQPQLVKIFPKVDFDFKHPRSSRSPVPPEFR